jgi:hypothetical protein
MGETPDYSTSGVPGTDDQYRNPTDATGKAQGYAWWQGLPLVPAAQPLTNLIGGDRYVNEADPSWEDVITMVVIPGDPGHIRTAAGHWEVLFRRVEQAKKLLDDGIGDLKSWEGAAGETYRNHLSAVSKSLGELIDKHQGIVVSMRTAADDLEKAINKIPIPDDMAYEVQAAKSNFDVSGKVTGFGPDAVYRTLLPIYGNKWIDQLRETFSWDWAQKNLRDWISGEDNKAKQAYKELAGNHVNTMDGMPQGAQIKYSQPIPTEPLPKTPPTGKVPKTDLPKTGMPDPKNPGLDKLPGQDKPDLPKTNMPGTPPGSTTDPRLDPPGLGDGPGTSLAGAGGGLSGAGGLGPGGLGAGGLGAGGLGPGGGLGAAGGLPGAGLGGAGVLPGAGAGRGVGGRGGRPGGMMGGMGGGHGAGAGAGEDEHSTWLSEDEDPWGTDNDAAPPVLGA